LNTLGQLWLAGARIDWHGVHAQEERRRVSLPGYPFQRERYWIDPPNLISPVLSSSVVVLPEDRGRVALPPLQLHARRRLSSEYIAPANETELGLAEIWGELLGVEQVGRRDNFFELGGHSLLATQLASRVRDVFNVELPLRSVYENPVVEKLAEVISQTRQGDVAGVDRISKGGPEEMLKGLDEMNAEEVSALLRQMLEADGITVDEVEK
jgi:acyl transferase domain-containing protein